MNVNANRLELLRAVKQAAAVVPNASPLEVLKGILLKAESNGHGCCERPPADPPLDG